MNRNHRNPLELRVIARAAMLIAFVASAPFTLASWNKTTAGVYDYTNTDNWANGAVDDTYTNITFTGIQTNRFSGNHATVGDLTIAYGGAYNLFMLSDGAADRTLTLNGDLIFTPGSPSSALLYIGQTNVNSNLGIDLGGAVRTISNGSPIIIIGPISNGGLIQNGNNFHPSYSAVTLGGGSADANANTYSGPTTVNFGYLILNKSNGVVAVGGDLLLNSTNSRVQYNQNHQIADTANVVIKGGQFAPGSDRSDVFNSLTLSNGAVTIAGSSSGSTFVTTNAAGTGFLTLVDGTFALYNRGPEWITDNLTISGGTNSVVANNNNKGALLRTGSLVINQPASGAFVALTMTNTPTSSKSAYFDVFGNLTFNGDPSNPESVTIVAQDNSPTAGADIQLRLSIASGTTNRIWTINDGGADVDLIIQPQIANSAGTAGITKEGAGTVLFAALTNTYNGPTVVNAGRLLLSGVLSGSSAVTVNSGGVLGASNAQMVIANAVTNAGTLSVVNAQAVFNKSVVNYGAYVSDPSTNTFNGVFTVGPTATVVAAVGDLYAFGSNLVIQSTNRAFDMHQATVLFANTNYAAASALGLTTTATNHTLSLAGSGAVDMGSNWLSAAQLSTNFSIGTLSIAAGNRLTLSGTRSGALTNALYVGWLDIQGILNTNDFTSVTNSLVAALSLPDINLYYDKNLAENGYLRGEAFSFWGGGGMLIPIPEPASAWITAVGLGASLLIWRRRRV